MTKLNRIGLIAVAAAMGLGMTTTRDGRLEGRLPRLC